MCYALVKVNDHPFNFCFRAPVNAVIMFAALFVPFRHSSAMLCWNCIALKIGFNCLGRSAKFWKSSLPPFKFD